MSKLYLAYGSNLNVEQMSRRCPKAKPLEGIVVDGWKLVFRSVADIIPCKDSMLSAGLWNITSDCEKALDAYEGFPTLYQKLYFKMDGKTILTYQMNRTNFAPPYQGYYDTILQGYKDFNLNTKFLEMARKDTLSPFSYII